MISNDFIEKLSTKAAEILPYANAARQEAEEKMYQLLKSQLGKLDLVTREEFDARLESLVAAQTRIADLEQRLNELEASTNAPSASENTPDNEA